MLIKAGFEIAYRCPDPTPMLLMLSLHPSRAPATFALRSTSRSTPEVRRANYVDGFGNVCTRIMAPEGLTTISTEFPHHGFRRSRIPSRPTQSSTRSKNCPRKRSCTCFNSRYCDTDHMHDLAWAALRQHAPRLGTRAGDLRLRARSHHLRLSNTHARRGRRRDSGTSYQKGVCRDFAHLAITLCRCMNIPARYCTGYLGNIGVPAVPCPWTSARGSKPTSAGAG